MKIIRKIKAHIYKVPFKTKEWYNYRAMLFKENLKNKSFIEIFDDKDYYIDCPDIGGKVIYNVCGVKYLYKIIGFENSSKNRDWLYDTDYINPVIEFIKKL